jgi:hypothetical protein
MSRKNSFQYASAFKNTLSPCYSQNGKQINKAGWHAGGGNSLFELYSRMKRGGTRKSKTNIRKRKTQRGGNSYPKNPPYMMTTCAHDKGVPCNSLPLNEKLYERSFQGPFPSRSAVNFELTQPFDNKLLVEPTPLNGGGLKKKKTKVKKKSTKVKKKSTKVKKKSIKVKKKSIRVKKKSIRVKKKSTKVKKKSIRVKKKSIRVKKKGTLKKYMP